MSLLVIFEILGLWINTMTTDNKYYIGYAENLLRPIQMQLPKNNFFLTFLLFFWNLHQVSNIWQKKDELHSSYISVITDW